MTSLKEMAKQSCKNVIGAQQSIELNPELVCKYFVAVTHDRKQTLRARLRDQLRLKMCNMSDPMNKVYDNSCDYQDEIYKTLLLDEKQRLKINFKPDANRNRQYGLSTMRTVAENFNLTRTTMHLAAYIMDFYVNQSHGLAQNLPLVVITSLCLASKIEENDGDIPRFSKLNKMVGDCYAMEDFKKMQWNIIKVFDYNLVRPTTATFVEYYATNFLTLEDFHIYGRNYNAARHQSPTCLQTVHRMHHPYFHTFDEMVSSLTTSLFEMADISLSYIKFTNTCPSIVAAACVGAVRYLYRLYAWTPYLANFTQYSIAFMDPHIESVLVLHKLFINRKMGKQQQNPYLYCSPDSGVGMHLSSNDENDSDRERIKVNTSGRELQMYPHCGKEYSPIKRRKLE